MLGVLGPGEAAGDLAQVSGGSPSARPPCRRSSRARHFSVLRDDPWPGAAYCCFRCKSATLDKYLGVHDN
jgi:hypothetical protein